MKLKPNRRASAHSFPLSIKVALPPSYPAAISIWHSRTEIILHSILGCRISISFRGLISHKYQQSTFLNKTITKKCSCPFVPLVTIESKAELFTDSLFEELRHNTRLNKLICSNISNCLFQGHLHGSTASVKIVW